MALDPALDGFLRLVEARGDIDGRFTNLRRIGLGGGGGQFSLVFAAWDNVSNREVAVKVYRPDQLLDTYRVQCFNREAQLLERLGGARGILGWVAPRGEFKERVQTTAGIGFELKFPFFVVELASCDVGALIRDGTWSAEQRLLAFRQMCKSIQRVHREGISHRDIKPSNFLVMGTGDVKLSDFGTARDLNGNEPPVAASYAAPPGDIRYSAPEMVALLHDDDPSIAFRGDLYALGATFFEMWTGTVLGLQLFGPLFAADLAKAMNAVHKRDRRRVYLQFVQSIASGHPLPSISSYGSGVPTSILELIDGLYKSISALDYRSRLCDFERIFLRIDQCVLVLRNEEKVRSWRRNKELFRRKREEKRTRLCKRREMTGHAGGNR
jgi:serine/threonine protein kinase